MSVAPLDRAVALPARGLLGLAAAMQSPRLSILIFHRVLPEIDPLFPHEVDARRFDRIMGLAASAFHVLPLGEAAHLLLHGGLPRRSLAITFDDGYADNHDVAAPILRRHGLAATFFVATGFLDGGRMWNDTIIECIRRCRQHKVDLQALQLPSLPLGSLDERRAAIEQVIQLVKYRKPGEREPMLRTLHRACGSPELPDDLMMTRAQVQALRRNGMTIGAHTVQHPILLSLDDDAARHEMAQSRKDLQNLLDDPIDTFAYPNGRPGQDYDQRHVSMARELGFAAAVSTAKGVSRPHADPFQLQRFTPWQTDPVRWLASLALNHALQ